MEKKLENCQKILFQRNKKIGVNKLEMNFKPNKHEFNKFYKILRREKCIGRKVLNRRT